MLTNYHPSDARSWARAHGESVGSHGRLSVEIVSQYLKANPQVARVLAADLGVEIAARGAVGLAACEEIAGLVR